jgi:hypothetical protein
MVHPHLTCIHEIHRVNFIDAARLDRVRRDVDCQSNLRQDRELRLRVAAIDILRRIGLGQSERLRFSQRLTERQAIAFHAAEDVVAGAVQDAGDSCQAVSREPMLNGAYHWHPAGNRCFESQMPTQSRCLGEQLGAAMRDHLFVCGHHRLASLQRFADPTLGW